MRLVCTPIDGMVSVTGRLTWADRCCGAAAIGPVGAGRVGAAAYSAATGWRVSASPAAPATARIRPAASTRKSARLLPGMPATLARHEADAKTAHRGEQQPGADEVQPGQR